MKKFFLFCVCAWMAQLGATNIAQVVEEIGLGVAKPHLKSNLTHIYIEQWDIPSGLFKWYRGAITLASGEQFEILPTYFDPYFFLVEGKEIEYFPVENQRGKPIDEYPTLSQVYILKDVETGFEIQAIPFVGNISPLSWNYGREYREICP